MARKNRLRHTPLDMPRPTREETSDWLAGVIARRLDIWQEENAARAAAKAREQADQSTGAA